MRAFVAKPSSSEHTHGSSAHSVAMPAPTHSTRRRRTRSWIFAPTRQLQQRALKRAGAILVFPGERGRVRSKQGVYAINKLALKRAQLDTADAVARSPPLFASHWMMDCGCIFRLSKILGHSNVKITQDVYAHLAPQAWEQDLRPRLVPRAERAGEDLRAKARREGQDRWPRCSGARVRGLLAQGQSGPQLKQLRPKAFGRKNVDMCRRCLSR